MVLYIRRVLSYLVKIALLLAVVYSVMSLTGNAIYGFAELFDSTRGQVLLVLVAVLALANPKLGFVTRKVQVGNDARRDIDNAMISMGYSLDSENGNVLTYRADNRFKRVWFLWDDALKVTLDGNIASVSGIRKQVVGVALRMPPCPVNTETNETEN